MTTFFCLGIWCAFLARPPFAPALICAAALTVACGVFSRRRRSAIILLFLAVFCAGIACAANYLALRADDISVLDPQGRVSIEGIVAEEPRGTGNKTRLVVSVRELIASGVSRRTSGLLLVSVRGSVDCGYGDRVLVTGEAVPAARAFPSGSRGYIGYLENHGIRCTLSCLPWELLVTQERAEGALRRGLFAAKTRAARIFDAFLSSPGAGVMQAMIIGEKRQVSPLVINAMVRSGTVHILVVSGFNVGIVAFILLIGMKLLRIPRRARFFALLPCVILYCALTGASEPVVRAGIMALVMAGAYLFRRDGDIHNAFAIALCAMLMANPRLMFDAGFQLSYASVFALIAVFPWLRQRLKIARIVSAPLRYAADGLLSSFSAWIVTAGFVAYYFRIVTPASVFINVAAVPLAGFITLCGFSLIIARAILPPLAPFIGAAADYAIALLVRIVSVHAGFFTLPPASGAGF